LGPDGEEENKQRIEPEIMNQKRKFLRRPNTTTLRTRQPLSSLVTTRETESREEGITFRDTKSKPGTARSSKTVEASPQNGKQNASQLSKYQIDHMENLYQKLINDFQPSTGVRLHLPNMKAEDNEVEGATLPSDFDLEDSKGNVTHQMTKDHFLRLTYAQRERLFAEAKERYMSMRSTNKLTTEEDQKKANHIQPAIMREAYAPGIEIKMFNPNAIVKKVKKGPGGSFGDVSIENEKGERISVLSGKPSLNESGFSQSTEGGYSRRKDKERVKDLSRVLETGNYVDLSSKKKGSGQNSIVMSTESRLIFMMFDQHQSRSLINTIRERATPYKERPPSPFKLDLNSVKPALEDGNDNETPKVIKSARPNDNTPIEIDGAVLRRKYSELGVKMTKEVMARAKTPTSTRPSTARMPSISANSKHSFSSLVAIRGHETNWKKALQNGQSPPRIKKGKFFITDA